MKDKKCYEQDEKKNVEEQEAVLEKQEATLKEWEVVLQKKVHEAKPVPDWMSCVVEEVVSQIQGCYKR